MKKHTKIAPIIYSATRLPITTIILLYRPFDELYNSRITVYMSIAINDKVLNSPFNNAKNIFVMFYCVCVCAIQLQDTIK